MASWRTLSICVSSFVVIVGSLAYLLFPIRQQEWTVTATPTTSSSSTPSKDPHEHFHAPAGNPWAELDEVEASQVYTFLYESSNALNLSRVRGGNQIYLVELLRPNKSDVVNYLDNHASVPPRWARVANLETHGHGDEAFIVDYMVGPLPPSNTTRILPLKYSHNSGRDRVQSPVSDVFALLEWALRIGENASDITQDLLGATTNRDDPSDPDALVMGSRPALIDGDGDGDGGGGRMVHWLEFFGPGIKSDGRSLLPQGLYVKLHLPSARPESWTTGEWFYNGILYANDTALRDAMSSPDFERLTINRDGGWTDTEVFDDGNDHEQLPERGMPPPLSIQPHGPRYHLDRTQSYLSWMGFSFYLSTTQSTALSLFDIRYNATRIMYELGLQEALAHYAGTEPMQSGLDFLDTFFGMGSMMFSLVPGVDCPGYAEYIDMSYHKGGKMYTNRNAICVFEYTSDAPLQRHTSAFSATVSRNTYLVVRSVSTVGNYDYTVSLLFSLLYWTFAFILLSAGPLLSSNPILQSSVLIDSIRSTTSSISTGRSRSNCAPVASSSGPSTLSLATLLCGATRRRTNTATASTRACTRRCTTTWSRSAPTSTSAAPPTLWSGRRSCLTSKTTTGTSLKSPDRETRCTWSTRP